MPIDVVVMLGLISFVSGLAVGFCVRTPRVPAFDSDVEPGQPTRLIRQSDRQLTAELEAALRKLNPQFGRARDSVIAADKHAADVFAQATTQRGGN